MDTQNRNSLCDCGSGKRFKHCCGGVEVLVKDVFKYADQAWVARDFKKAYEIYFDLSRVNDLPEILMGLGVTRFCLDDIDTGLSDLKAYFLLCDHSVESYLIVISKFREHRMLEECLDIVELGLTEKKDALQLLSIKGDLLELLNQALPAVAVLERANQLSENEPSVVIPLARSYRRLKRNDEAQQLLQQCINNIGPDHPRISSLESELGFVFEALGLFSESFAARARRGLNRLNIEKVKEMDERSPFRMIDSLEQWLSRGGKNNLAKKGLDTHVFVQRPVFLIGFPRSGTTLLEQMLSSHSDVSSSEEKSLFVYVRRYLNEKYSGISVPEMLDTITEEDIAQCREIYFTEVQKVNINKNQCFIDKLPMNMMHIATLNLIFPEAKYVFSMRDPRAVCISCFFQSFRPNPVMKNFLLWETTTDFYKKVMDYWLMARESFDLGIHYVSYEKLVTNTEAEIKEAVDFLGLDWEPSVLNYQQNTANRFVGTPNYHAVRQDIYKDALKAWKNHPDAIRQARPNLERLVKIFGYGSY